MSDSTNVHLPVAASHRDVAPLTGEASGSSIASALEGLVLLSQKVSAVFETNHVFGEIHFSACEGLG